MMVDLQQVIESLIDRQLEQRNRIDSLERDLKRAFDEIATLRTPATPTGDRP